MKILLAFLSVPFLCSAQLHIEEGTTPVVLFGAAAQTIQVPVRNEGGETIHGVLQGRLYQVAGRLTAPLTEMRELLPLEIPARQTVLSSIQIDVPEVRTATRFRLQFTFGNAQSAGFITIVAIPLNALRELADTHTLLLHDPQLRLQKALHDLGASTVPLTDRHSIDGSGAIIGVAWFTSESRDTAQSDMATIIKHVEAGANFLCVVEPGVTPRGLPPFPVITRKGQGILATASSVWLQDLATSASAQWNLLQILSAMKSPDSFPF